MALHQEPYSNPIAPPDHEPTRGAGKLSNDDFRKLMMTPRATTTASQSRESKISTEAKKQQIKKRRTSGSGFQALVQKEDEERQAEWAKIYRDRAKERREGQNPDYNAEKAPVLTSGYKAVAPTSDPSAVARQRQQLIQESKFLGGDMAHTHMVKGLDYALLQKVRSEISTKERIEEMERKIIEKRKEKEKNMPGKQQSGGDVTFRTRMAKNIYRTLFQEKPPERNEFFLPGRMAYVFELNDEYAESDIPTTLLRSKADCSTKEVQATLSTNDIVINKLTQILSYLRQGSLTKKKKKDKAPVQQATTPVPQKKPMLSEKWIICC